VRTVSDNTPSARFTPFAYGFRPFFLASIAYGLAAVVIWMGIRAIGGTPLPAMPPQLWHGHEMLFGFIAAAIAGFLLTAVPSWTGTRGFAGWPLITLTALWLAGRVAFGLSSFLPSRVVALIELAFLPALALLVAVPLLRARNRNTPLLLVLAALWFVDATFVCAVALGDIALASSALRVGIDIVLLLITVIGGRIVPAFTANALRRNGIDAQMREDRWSSVVTIGAMVAVVAADVFVEDHRTIALVAGIAALAQAYRLTGWGGLRSINEPIVWVLHLAYLWLPVGLALKALHLATGVDWASAWLHALAMGAAATMIVAVITRAALGHTGRPLVVPRSVAIAYVALGLASLLRALAPALPDFSEWTIQISAVLWSAAFIVVLFVYTPILVRPRVDGREG
jgi:uncharacterized protein involved in response to NO